MTTSIRIQAERIMKAIAGASERNRDEKIDQRDVEARFIAEINRAAKLGLYENMKMDYKSVGSCYITTFRDVTVQYDDDMELAYCNMPASYIELPHGKGFDYVGPMVARSLEFIPTDPHNGFTSRFSMGANLEGMVGYWPELGPSGQRVYFNRNIIEIDEIDKVLMRLVIVDASVINRDAPLQLDPALETDLVDRTIAFFVGNDKLGKDITNNSISDKQ